MEVTNSLSTLLDIQYSKRIEFTTKEKNMPEMFNTIYSMIFYEKNLNQNDVFVQCQNGEICIPSILMAAICPVFRSSHDSLLSNEFSVILPDIKLDQFEVFLYHVCHSFNLNSFISEDIIMDIKKIMDLLCCPFVESYTLHNTQKKKMDNLNQKKNIHKKFNHLKLEILDPQKNTENDTINIQPKNKKYESENKFFKSYIEKSGGKIKSSQPESITRMSQRTEAKSTIRKRSCLTSDSSKYCKCPKCGVYRRIGTSYRYHLQRCDTGAARIVCTECGLEFKRSEELQVHRLFHFGRITCPIHNILFHQESEVFHHVYQTGSKHKDPKLQCCMCQAHFKHLCNFMKHMRRHLKIQPFKCDICQKSFHGFASLKVHKRTVHKILDSSKDIQTSFKCKLCDKIFCTKGHLKEHISGVHEGKQVNCPICTKSFNTEKRMKKHLFNLHKEAGDNYRLKNKVEVFSGVVI